MVVKIFGGDVQLLSCVRLFLTPWTAARQASLSIANSQSLLKLMSIECSCLEKPRDGGAWWATVYGVAQSRTRVKRLSSSSSNGSLEDPTYHVS